MSEGNQNFYRHLDNCLPNNCQAGCLHSIFQHGWEACEREQKEASEMDSLNARIRVGRSTFLLSMIGHLDGDYIVGNYDAATWGRSVDRLWDLYLEV